MKISREEIMKVVDNPKTICWSDVLVGLNLLPLFEKYKKENNKDYYIGKVFMGKTLMNNICNILKERVVKSKDKRIRHLRDKYKLSAYAWDCLQSQPTEVKEELAKKNYKDKDKELVYIVALSIAKYVQELEKL